MTDIQSETQNVQTHSEGDQLTVRRGKVKGETGTVIYVSGTGEQAEYTLKLPDGRATVQPASNVKALPERTVGESALVSAVQGVLNRNPDVDRLALNELINSLERHIPGFDQKVAWPEPDHATA